MLERPPHFTPPRNRRLPVQAYRGAQHPCFITLRAYRRQAPFTRSELSDEIVDTLLAERHRSHCDLYAYCLMPDHLHLVAAPRVEGASVLAFVDRFKGISTRRSWQFGIRGKLWQPRSYDHVLRDDTNLIEVCAYVLGNPVRAGLVEESSAYRWCGLVDPILE
jgi:putative transposase